MRSLMSAGGFRLYAPISELMRSISRSFAALLVAREFLSMLTNTLVSLASVLIGNLATIFSISSRMESFDWW